LDVTIDGAKGVLLVIAGGRDLKMNEINDIAKAVAEAVDPNARIIFGAYHDRRLKQGEIKVTVIATGFNSSKPANSLFSGFTEKESVLPSFMNEEVAMPGITEFKPLESKIEEKERDDDAWDIPAFMRKRKR
jgi:cell division protein FtsZ